MEFLESSLIWKDVFFFSSTFLLLDMIMEGLMSVLDPEGILRLETTS